MDNENNKQAPKEYIYDVAANGITVRIPADQYDSWKAAQDRIRNGNRVTIDPETSKRLAELMKSKAEQSAPPKKDVAPQAPEDNYRKEDTNKEPITNNKKSIFASIPLSVLGFLEYYLIYGIAFLIIALLFWIISYIPILNTLVDWLFRIREDTPDMFAMFASTGIAYLGFTATIEHISKKAETQKLTLILTGIYIIVLNVIFLIVNLVLRNTILPNVFLGIAGVVIFFKGKNI